MSSRSWKIVAAVLTCVSLTVAASACDEPGPDPNQYLTPIAQARAAGVPVYWLGPSFEAGGQEFPANQGVLSPGFAGQSVQGIEVDYFPNDRFWGKLRLSSFTSEEWQKAQASFLRAAASSGSLQSADVNVGAYPATMLYYRLGDDPVHWRAIVVRAGGAVVVAQTNAVGAAPGADATVLASPCPSQPVEPGSFARNCPAGSQRTPGPDANPLVDEQIFLAVMQNLRPYPQ